MNGYLWALPLIILALGAGLYFSLRMKFPQLRLFKDMWRFLIGKDKKDSEKSSKEGMSSFQSFALALGGRVGVGNIAGVATAIYFGGPGAVFWMWVIAFIGAGTAFAESALAQTYKVKVDGEYKGGPHTTSKKEPEFVFLQLHMPLRQFWRTRLQVLPFRHLTSQIPRIWHLD